MSFLEHLFEKIVAGEIPSWKVYEDDLVYSFLDINPLHPGHALVIPKVKYTRVDQVPPATAAALGAAVAKVAKAVCAATGVENYNVLQNNGKPAHQEVPHVHFHIIPKSGAGGLGVKWAASPIVDAEAMQARVVAALAAPQDAAAAAAAHRLPTTVRPRNYRLRLCPDLEAFTFTGTVAIECDVLAANTTAVVLHAHELEVSAAACTPSGAAAATPAAGIALDTAKQQLTLTFPEPGLPKGACTLDLTFTGCLNDKMAGFYRSTYTGADGTQKVMATTQFEATDARRSFPCWDEPAFKATFDVTMVVRDPSLTALSNMPVRSRDELPDGAGVAYTYFRSPVMSTYLLAFVIGELEAVSSRTRSGTEVSVYVTPGKLGQAAFALDTAVQVLDFFTDYMGIGFPLPKCDMVGIPDFASGAMENWGLVTYRETALFATDDSSAAARQRVAYVVAHELAHQWFGNLVTMAWWSDLWLNEGFATWAGNLAVDNVFPGWDTWTQFTNDDANYALSTDALLSSHPIQVTINDPAEIDQVFDALSYSKGACMIRMVESHVGADTFRRGLRNYLEKHQYKNTVTADLWAAVSECAGYDVATIMDSWCLHVGFPVISVRESAGNSDLGLIQRRFKQVTAGAVESKEAAAAAAAGGDHFWQVPLSAITEDGPAFKVMVDKADFVCDGAALQGKSWYKLNAGQTSFVRVNYTAAGWANLKAPVASLALPAVDRLGVASDVFALAAAGLGDTATALDMALAFRENERVYSVWSAVSGGVGQVSEILEQCAFYPRFEKYCQQLYDGLFAHLGWDPKPSDSHTTSMLRALCLAAVAKYGNKDVVAEALSRFGAYVDTGELAPDLRTVVFNCAVQYGGKEQFDQMLRLFESAETPELKMKALVALGKARDPASVQRYLDFAFSGQVRSNNVLYVFATLASNPAGRGPAWEFVKANWESKIIPMFKGSHAMLAYMVALPLRGFTTAEMADEGEAFFKEHPVPEAAMKLSQVLEKIRSKAAWLSRDGAAVGAWLEANGFSAEGLARGGARRLNRELRGIPGIVGP